MGYIQKKSEQSGLSVEEELTSICVHGMCHLLGYTHRGEKGRFFICHSLTQDFAQMLEKESEVMEALKHE